MSLSDALLLDPHRHPNDVWLAVRTDGLKGSGTESDPYNASAKSTLENPDINIGNGNLTAALVGGQWLATVVTSTPHGLHDGDWVTISGVTLVDTLVYPPSGDPYYEDNNIRYCGTFQVKENSVTSNTTFQYIMQGAPKDTTAPGSALKCWLEREQFDAIMRTLPGKDDTHPGTAIHLGPGVFPTKGYSLNAGRIEYYSGVYINGSWQPRTGQKILGSGMAVTTLKLVGADVKYAQYWAVGSDYNVIVDGFEISDLTVDCNIADQPEHNLVAQAISVVGSHIRIRRVRAINFGTQMPIGSSNPVPFVEECFVIGAGGGHPDVTTPVDCVIEDCILEQPGLNNARETTCLSIQASESTSVPNQGIMAFPGPCAIRNCFLNLEYQDHPVRIVSIEPPDQGGVSRVTTSKPHELAANQWIRINGAVVAGRPLNGLDNPYNGSYQVHSINPGGNNRQFTYIPIVISGEQSVTTAPTGNIWLGRFPSLSVGINSASADSNKVITITTAAPHFLVVGSAVQVRDINDGIGTWVVTAVDNRKQFRYYCPPCLTNGPIASDGNNGSIGATFQGISGAEIIEGNRVFNCHRAGPYQDTYSAKTLIVRNNHYHNVFMGQFQLMGRASGKVLAASLDYGDPDVKTATFKVLSEKPHGLTVGQGVRIEDVRINNGGLPPDRSYNGVYKVSSVSLEDNSFTYIMDTSPGATADLNRGTVSALWQVSHMITENNVIELAPAFNNAGPPTAIALWGAPQDEEMAEKGFRIYRRVVIRNNIIRSATRYADSSGNLGISLISCEYALVENNIVDLALTDPVIRHRECDKVLYFNNSKSDGTLIQGAEQPFINGTPGPFTKQAELTTMIDDALVLSIL